MRFDACRLYSPTSARPGGWQIWPRGWAKRAAMKWVVLGTLLACSWPSAALADPQTQVLDISFHSAALSQFLQRPMTIGATVLLPDSYYKEPARRYPVIYVVPAFDGDYELSMREQLAWQAPMRELHREFIVVFLQGMVKIGSEWLHDQYADSANDGPWGTALTTEFIPETDAHFRTIPASNYRFLFGHSSGAWSALWLQVNYPDTFGGVWALSPDPVDFHDFFGPDLTKNPPQNFYRSPAGNAYGMYQENGRDLSTIQKSSRSRPSGCGASWTPTTRSTARKLRMAHPRICSTARPARSILRSRNTGKHTTTSRICS
jgi:enterochelin esterase-like enzyme